jgi:hypothetical protein
MGLKLNTRPDPYKPRHARIASRWRFDAFLHRLLRRT